MQTIIEQDGRFYVQETKIVRQTTLTLLEGRLSEIKEHKKTVLAETAAECDAMSAEVEKQIQEIKKLQEKRLETVVKPQRSKAPAKPGKPKGRKAR